MYPQERGCGTLVAATGTAVVTGPVATTGVAVVTVIVMATGTAMVTVVVVATGVVVMTGVVSRGRGLLAHPQPEAGVPTFQLGTPRRRDVQISCLLSSLDGNEVAPGGPLEQYPSTKYKRMKHERMKAASLLMNHITPN